MWDSNLRSYIGNPSIEVWISQYYLVVSDVKLSRDINEGLTCSCLHIPDIPDDRVGSFWKEESFGATRLSAHHERNSEKDYGTHQ